MRWISDDAKRMFDLLNEERLRIAAHFGLRTPHDGLDATLTATELRARTRRLDTPERAAAAMAEYRLAVAGIEKRMVALVAEFTAPEPIIIEKQA